MSRTTTAFARGKALIGYITLGYPDPGAALEIVPTLAREGCDMVELGIPFSDPLADGATIQEASHRALEAGTTPALCLELAAEIRRRVEVPLIFMSYYNPLLRLGLETFCRVAARAGVDGLIIPDLPPEEGGALERAARSHDLDLTYLLAPNSSQERVELVATRSRGFIYLVSLTGVTGPREELAPGVEGFVARMRERATLPLAVGFGISSAQQASRLARVADGVIVGSRLLQLIREDSTLGQLGAFVAELARAIHGKG